ncbi:hypothetical protein DFP72DRAFT_526671 [Ephemerocybe angulata]|uniref:J domain-containing protein n=1 Tax=Ephemerocybe angulata TaxID=980116 RepID=A0A8H6IFE5_9AGAR|nr:hypothetical protein DFP72DRAFT_526671 [Tulosesus angulatus]
MLSLPSASSQSWASTLCQSCRQCSRTAVSVTRPGRRRRAPSSSFTPASRRAFSSSLKAWAEASTSSGSGGSSSNANTNAYPYPSRKNPSPHEIFHLPRNATEADVKARYFDLVRIYHPDKATDLAAEDAHARFRAITSAYDILRGKRTGGIGEDGVDGGINANVDLRYQTTAAWRAAHRKRQQELYSSGAADEKWKDRIILFGVVSTIVFVVANTFTTRKEAMAEALSRTRGVNEYRFSEQQQARLRQQQDRARAEEESRLSAAPELGETRLTPES